jgi:hypothetical protein
MKFIYENYLFAKERGISNGQTKSRDSEGKIKGSEKKGRDSDSEQSAKPNALGKVLL